MHAARWATCLWPGLPRLWFEGSWAALGCALAFAALFNFCLLSSFIWTEWVASGLRSGSWAVAGAMWGVSLLTNVCWLAQPDAPSAGAIAGDLFPQALDEYLRGHWYEVEQLCRRLLGADQADVEASLLLASTLRRGGRHGEAREQLAALLRLDGAARWEHEIGVELKLLAEQANPADVESGVAQGVGPEVAPDLADEVGVAAETVAVDQVEVADELAVQPARIETQRGAA